LLELGRRSFGLEAVCVAGGSERRTLVFINDATEQLAARREAERSAEQLRTILRASRDGAALIQDDDVLYANEAWRTLTGAAGLGLRGLLDEPVEGRPLWRRLAELAGNSEVSSLDVGVAEGSVHEAQFELTAVTVRYEARDCLLVMARDLSARRRLEAQMSRNERLASLGMLVAGVAHEINNPLGYTLNNLESLAARLDGAPATLRPDEALEVIRDAITVASASRPSCESCARSTAPRLRRFPRWIPIRSCVTPCASWRRSAGRWRASRRSSMTCHPYAACKPAWCRC
jgi:signal transduction histidine kinase